MRTALVAACLIAVALAGCADEPEPTPPPQGIASTQAAAVLAEGDPTTDGTLIALFAHGAKESRVPWPFGPVGLYEHLHRSSGKNGAMDRGAANDWYSMHLDRTGDGPKIVFSDIGGAVDVQRSFNAEHFGWPLEWATSELSCRFATESIDGVIDSTDAWAIAAAQPLFAAALNESGDAMMMLLPDRSLSGDCNGRAAPLGFGALPDGPLWAVFWSDLDPLLSGTSFLGGAVVVLDAATGAVHSAEALSGPWGPEVLKSERTTATIGFPGTPVAPWQAETAFAVPDGAAALDVSTRWVGGPALMGDVTVTLQPPSGDGMSMPTHGDWTIEAPAAGGWKVIHSSEQAPLGDAMFDVAVLAL